MPMNKEMDAKSVVAQLRDGMTIGVGGWGPRRKPMALIREILRSDLKDLTIAAYGGPEVGMLCAAGKVRKLIYGFVSLDAIPIEPYFRKAREAGSIEVNELDEGLLLLGLQAAGHQLPFLPTRVGLGSDVMTYNPYLKTVRSPYEDGEELLAMKAIRLDAALIHVSRSDRLGNTQTDGPDPYFDPLFARAADKVFVTAEELVDRIDISHPHLAKNNLFERYLVTGVVSAPLGAHPTTSHDGYGWDMAHLKVYSASASEESGWKRYFDEFIAGGEEGYLDRVGGRAHVRALPIPAF
ncbi:CoA transferase subunit A [Microvirga puerhi]|uniref:Acyl CoA--acetate/3-ketoacid CoA transferase subunit alpha n=1 Tax=Microvirga puerhi TaxID=2876078 RepID=A0ABS7VUP2_9HYPH|nr:CoA-transferase [Microvirga puerhi]MBZ6079292.1 acyl CoA--acetate/3-ketoacid CoA transferase subunit alpha [Microvirga puerhi]